jgi:FHA domain
MFELVLETPKIEHSPKWIFKGNEIFTGSTNDNDFYLNIKDVCEREFHIYLYKDDLWIKRYDGNGVLIVDGVNVDKGDCKKINKNCTIIYLKHVFSLNFKDNSDDSIHRKKIINLELNLKNENKGISLHNSGMINIGRGIDNHLSFDYNLLSKNHLQIKNIDGDLWIQDLNSKNGTYINGKKLLKPELWNFNSIIKIGDLSVRIHEKPDKE